jgi:hypothetical protein
MGMMLPQDPLAAGWAGPDENAAPPGEAAGPYNTGTALISGTVTITITRVEGSGGEIGYGPAQIAPPGYGSCTHYNSRDDCKSCCVSVSSIAVTSIIGAGVACHVAASICIPCHVACALVEAAALIVIGMAGNDCQRNCERRVTW